MIGFGTSAVGLAGTALAFVMPDFFAFATYASALGGAGVLFKALTAAGWYDEWIDETDTTMDTAGELDPTFDKSKNYLLLGGLLSFAASAYAIAMPILSAPAAEAPAEEPVDPTAEEAPVEEQFASFAW